MGCRVGIASDIVTINSLTISPDPPKPGQDITVTVNATTSETILVGGLGEWSIQCSLTIWFRRVHMPTLLSSWV